MGEELNLGRVRGDDGSSIQDIKRTSGDGSPGTTDTYTITLTNGATHTFQVYNGADGGVVGVDSFNGRQGKVIPQTGDYTAAMVGAAPSGFGLGTEAPKSVSSWDAAIENGYYKAPAPSGVDSGTLWGYTVSLAGTYKYQQIFSDGYKASVCRYMINGKWTPFEWINPPMLLGVEYRTTERYNGKPVYVKLFSFGLLPDNTYKTVAVAENTQSVFDFSFTAGGVGTLFITSIYERAIATNAGITIVTTYANASSLGEVLVTAKYTKTTD